MRILIMFGLVLFSSGCVLAVPPETKFTVRALDAETNLPITNALVRAKFNQRHDPWGNGVAQWNEIKIPVDKNGEAVLQGRSIDDGESGRVIADGYYTEGKGFKYSGCNVVLNRWEPWNPTIEMQLRRKKNPVAMVFRERHYNVFNVPKYDSPIGYDLEKQTFAKPYGKGERSDISLTFTRKFENSWNFAVSCTLTFPNEGDGIQEHYIDEKIRSSFKWPYLAPTNNYERTLIWHSKRIAGKPVKHNFKDDVNYIFRVRTQKGEDGNIISACYGKIEGPFGLGWADKVNWVYWFNPTPNERSLEYNGKNLFK